jgi:hypothetical protein
MESKWIKVFPKLDEQQKLKKPFAVLQTKIELKYRKK